MAVNIKELKPGNAYTENNDLFLCISNDQNKQGRLSGKYMVKRKNMRTSAITEVSYNPTAKIDLAMIEKRKMQYLYDSGDSFVFMDNETYEQIEIPASRLEWEKNFLKPSDEVEMQLSKLDIKLKFLYLLMKVKLLLLIQLMVNIKEERKLFFS